MPAGRPVLMGVVNVTPDSFSDGGRWATPDAAIAHGRDLLADGADILDIGGESTRPGATRPLVEEELGRVVPVIRALSPRRRDGLGRHDARRRWPQQAVAAGATIVNDVSGGLADPRILDVVADSGATYVCMHWRAHSDRMQRPRGVRRSGRRARRRCATSCPSGSTRRGRPASPTSGSCSTPGWVRQDGRAQLGAARRAPGPAVARLPAAGRAPAASRSSAPCSPDADGEPRPVDDREDATTALTVLLAQQRVWGLRVHDVRASRDALRTLARWEEGDDDDRRAVRAPGSSASPTTASSSTRRRDGQVVRRSTSSWASTPGPRPPPTTCTTRWTTEVSSRT